MYHILQLNPTVNPNGGTINISPFGQFLVFKDLAV